MDLIKNAPSISENQTQRLMGELLSHYPEKCLMQGVCSNIISARVKELSGSVAANLMHSDMAKTLVAQEAGRLICQNPSRPC